MGHYAKAIIGALIAGLTALGTGLPDGVTPQEWLGAAIATAVAFSAVWATPNKLAARPRTEVL